MIGNNSIKICDGQMIKAMQYWLENVWLKDLAGKFVVEAVEHNKSNYDSTFTITVQGLEESK